MSASTGSRSQERPMRGDRTTAGQVGSHEKKLDLNKQRSGGRGTAWQRVIPSPAQSSGWAAGGGKKKTSSSIPWDTDLLRQPRGLFDVSGEVQVHTDGAVRRTSMHHSHPCQLEWTSICTPLRARFCSRFGPFLSAQDCSCRF